MPPAELTPAAPVGSKAAEAMPVESDRGPAVKVDVKPSEVDFLQDGNRTRVVVDGKFVPYQPDGRF